MLALTEIFYPSSKHLGSSSRLGGAVNFVGFMRGIPADPMWVVE